MSSIICVALGVWFIVEGQLGLALGLFGAAVFLPGQKNRMAKRSGQRLENRVRARLDRETKEAAVVAKIQGARPAPRPATAPNARGRVLACSICGGAISGDGDWRWCSVCKKYCDAREHKEQAAEHAATAAAIGQAQAAAPPAKEDVLHQLKKLAELRDAGVLSEEEFAAKKTELLSRL